MNLKHYKALHYLLIILLMFAPLRSVMAAQMAACDMADMDELSTSMSASMHGHDMHDMSSAVMTSDQMLAESSTANHQCCCCDSECVSNCDMGVTASLHMQASSYSPRYLNVANSSRFTSEILVRALTPPSRPPASIS